jgi:hypothetical protein
MQFIEEIMSIGRILPVETAVAATLLWQWRGQALTNASPTSVIRKPRS